MKRKIVNEIMREIVEESCGLLTFTAEKYKAKYEARHPDGARLLAEREARRERLRLNPESPSPRKLTDDGWRASFQLCEVWPYVALRYGCNDSAHIDVKNSKSRTLKGAAAYLLGNSIPLESRKRDETTLEQILLKMNSETESEIENENAY